MINIYRSHLKIPYVELNGPRCFDVQGIEKHVPGLDRGSYPLGIKYGVLFFILLLTQSGFANSLVLAHRLNKPSKSVVQNFFQTQSAYEIVSNTQEPSSIKPTSPTQEPSSPEPTKEISNPPLPSRWEPSSAESQNPPFTQTKKTKIKKSKQVKNKKWVLFDWLSRNHLSLEWAYGVLKDKDLYAPPLLQEKITKNFKNEALLYLNFHRDIIRFPYILDWGLKASMGLARSYDLKSDYFFPLSFSMIVSMRIKKHQPVVPFAEGGFSSWNINMSGDFSDIFPFWTVGAFVSFSLFKPSLQYMFVNDYGVHDIGFALEWRNHLSPFKQEERGLFLKTFHLGFYCHF